MYDLRFEKDFTYIIAGPSKSGKTVHVCKFLENQDILLKGGQRKNVIYCYKEYSDRLENLKKKGFISKFHSGLPSEDFIRKETSPFTEQGGSLIVIDDFGLELNSDINLLFTVLSHHLNISVILILQTLFSNNPVYRQISLNSQYLSIFKNERDKSVITNFAKQYAPGEGTFIKQAYSSATTEPHGYLFFDFTQKCPEHLRIRSHIIPGEGPPRVYVKKK